MIDFDKSTVFKLKPIPNEKMLEPIRPFLIEGENVFACFKSVRDQLVFTSKRIIAANVQGITGSKLRST